MIRSLLTIAFFVSFSTGIISAQSFTTAAEIFKRPGNNFNAGQLNIAPNPAIDTLLSRYILMGKKVYKEKNYYGMNGWRIQIYARNSRNARDESNKARADFMNMFPDIVSYPLYQDPGYFKIRVGDFRTKTEATKLYQRIRKEFPDSYIVPDIINFPDLNIK